MKRIEWLFRLIKRRRPISYTALPQGKISSAVKPLAQYRYRPEQSRKAK